MTKRRGICVDVLICLILATFTVSVTGCGSAAKSSVMPAMVKKDDIKVSQYKIAIAENMSVDKILTVSGTVMYENSEKLSFLVDGHLKAIHTELNKMVNAGDLLAELDTDDLENQLARKRIELQRTQLRYDQILLDVGEGSEAQNADLRTIKLDMKGINLDISNILKKINESKLVSPISGIVSDIEPCEIGNTVQPGKTYITVSKPDELYVQSQSLNPEAGDYESAYSDLSGIMAGTKATIIYGVTNKVKIPATITQVINTDPGIRKTDQMEPVSDTPPLFLINVRPDGKLPDKISANSTVNIEINSGKLDNVIVVPRNAVDGFADDTIVRVISGGKVIKRNVSTGYENRDAKIIVITSGLRAGESVIVN